MSDFTSHIVQIKHNDDTPPDDDFPDFTSHIVQIKPHQEVRKTFSIFCFTSHIVQIKQSSHEPFRSTWTPLHPT